MPTIRSETTPNPNSLKFTADAGSFLDGGMEAFASSSEAEGHPLGERLFSISGVEDVFITPEFVTVSKASAADWSRLAPKLESTLEAHLSESPS
jgi:hypothetical protein